MQMRSKVTLLKQGLLHPTSVPKYVLGKLFPNSGWGSVVEFKDDFITFTEGGFVEHARTRPAFCALQYYEVTMLRSLLADLAPGGSFDRSLEVGCGYGRLTPWIADFADRADAVEPNEEAVRDAAIQYPHVEFRDELAQDLSYDDDSFDLLVTWTVLQHVPPDLIDDVTDELRRVATPDAVFVLGEQVDELDRPNAWGRSDAEYERLLSPYESIVSFPKPAERARVDGDVRTVHPHQDVMVLARTDVDRPKPLSVDVSELTVRDR